MQCAAAGKSISHESAHQVTPEPFYLEYNAIRIGAPCVEDVNLNVVPTNPHECKSSLTPIEHVSTGYGTCPLLHALLHESETHALRQEARPRNHPR